MVVKRKNIKLPEDHTVEISLPSEIGYERIAMECSASFARIVGFVPERIEDLKTAVAEACTNAMEHGNKSHPDTKIVVNMNYRDHIFVVNVIDQGKGIKEPPEVFRKKDIDKKIENLQRPRGIGLFLIKHLVDQLEFNQITDRGHGVRMTFKNKDKAYDYE